MLTSVHKAELLSWGCIEDRVHPLQHSKWHKSMQRQLPSKASRLPDQETPVTIAEKHNLFDAPVFAVSFYFLPSKANDIHRGAL